MIPGQAQILTCPYCGEEKLIMSLISGNTYNSERWSDGKLIAPYFPEISRIQKCPHCGKYFNKTKQKSRYHETEHSSDRGTLSFEEAKEALKQMKEEGFKDFQDEALIRNTVFLAYNDHYHRSEEKHEISEEDKALFMEQVEWLIGHTTEKARIAELLREMGDLKRAKEVLDRARKENENTILFIEKVSEHIDANDDRVFLL